MRIAGQGTGGGSRPGPRQRLSSNRTSRLIGYLPIAPDASVVRDHRKIVFYDLTELDPGRGAALFGGVGVGEQYASPTWEDRAVRLAGLI